MRGVHRVCARRLLHQAAHRAFRAFRLGRGDVHFRARGSGRHQPADRLHHGNAHEAGGPERQPAGGPRSCTGPVAGKTGTSNNEQGRLVHGLRPVPADRGVYVGFDELKPMGKWETGSRAASPIWVDYRKTVEEDYPYQDFTQPPGIVMVQVGRQYRQARLRPAPAWNSSCRSRWVRNPRRCRRAPGGGSDAPASQDGPVQADLLGKDTVWNSISTRWTPLRTGVFSGNPAAVIPLFEWLSDDLMQKIAAENNLSETAFFVQKGRVFRASLVHVRSRGGPVRPRHPCQRLRALRTPGLHRPRGGLRDPVRAAVRGQGRGTTTPWTSRPGPCGEIQVTERVTKALGERAYRTLHGRTGHDGGLRDRGPGAQSGAGFPAGVAARQACA